MMLKTLQESLDGIDEAFQALLGSIDRVQSLALEIDLKIQQLSEDINEEMWKGREIN
jgi:uncharacterized protein YoxC